jgi:diaminohydroxyphosphoribosylaminopyrimidine deaminase/5-amino-6-(5-phosphoribosylamino)uracil reductase
LERAHNAIPDSPDTDAAFMAEALALAASTPVRPWPNPPVGALVVKNGRVVGRGAHHGPGSPHAETVALAEAGAQASGATLFVTLEPCNHTGRTPPCAPAVAASGVTRVVVAMRDPNPQVRGGGCRHLRERGLQVSIGVGAAEALELVWPFAVTNGFERPYVELKTAVSLDGRFAPPAARRQETAPVYLTMTDTRRLVHRRRRWSDAVIVGEGTARADRPRLDGRLADGQAGVPSNEPVAVCLDTDLSWGGGLGRIPFLVVAGEGARRAANLEALTACGGEVIFCRETGGRLDLGAALAALHARGLGALLFEGGPELSAALLVQGLVDRWRQFVAPVVLGDGVTWPVNGQVNGQVNGPLNGPVIGAADGPRAEIAGAASAFTLTSCACIGRDAMLVHDRTSFAAKLDQVSR